CARDFDTSGWHKWYFDLW
nr:immunoglobulin heavy chain junction region [Macaca mulatta]MPN69423.1 immunoglobulin heavy chain junction region [Macaca mulatta]MPN69648.1 immunoglobulin heavy chain junction region [Macaca mulatta]MPN69673.1 immunoglobulin heavy chain junction region [Macaca mulatta]MPN70160.1 immunoglobulin heavy chain junction region [Macaca mulatta]